MKKIHETSLVWHMLAAIFCQTLVAQVPQLINFQGRVAVNGIPYHGTGQFKFALVNSDGSQSYWLNAEDTNPPDGEPDAAVSLTVTRGLYNVLLGDTSVGNMAAIARGVFEHDGVWLRVWFNDGTHGFQQLMPDQRVGAVGYAMLAEAAQTVPDGAITETKIADGAVGSAQLAPVIGIWDKTGSTISYAGDATVTGSLSVGENVTVSGTVTVQKLVVIAAEPPANVIPVLGMVWIKPGTFIMGSPASDPNSDSDERPQTVVTLTRGFWMGVHEVTQGEYQAVMGTNPSYFNGGSYGVDLNRPVEQVSWNDAVAYCNALTTQERAAGRIPSNWRYYLPTEAQWEYACRAGARTARYCYGDDLGITALGNYAWYSGNSGGTTHPVEQKLGNAWGLMDMHGNVVEWCADWYAAYPGGSVTDPTGPTSGSNRVIRGGGWDANGRFCRSAYRGYGWPGGRLDSFGFRVALVQVP